MRYLIVIFFFLNVIGAIGQPLADINYNYLYDPDQKFTFELEPVREEASWNVFYKLQIRDTAFRAGDFTVHWEIRKTLGEKESTDSTSAAATQTSQDVSGFSGSVVCPVAATPNILVARVIHNPLKQAWIFYRILEANYPVTQKVIVNQRPLLRKYVNLSDKISIDGSGQKIISYYNDDFPAALPPFAESQTSVSAAITTDSTIFIPDGQQTAFSMTGLYLVQKDTNSAEGVAFRVQDDYPRLAKVPSLAGPFMYICTRDEVNRLKNAKNDKRAFDRIILSITYDTERARKLMRSYFRKVELANQYFTSYKEGWKTDRGMIYIIFGLPDQVFKFSDREVWKYDNAFFKVTLNFAKSSSIFDPENYVLIREKKYRETWLETVDLWRNARF